MTLNEKRIKYGCYMANISMAIICNVPPILFLIFRSMYGISYSMLGLMVLVNYLTQLGIDLIFSFFSHKFNLSQTVKYTPAFTFAGLLIFALCPFVMKENVIIGLLAGTVIFSVSGGLVEVLISPVIAALPSDDPEREMSKLHSIYAWGVVGVIPVSTFFLRIFGPQSWQWLILILTVLPLVSVLLFAGASFPHLETPKRTSGALKLMKNKGVSLFVAAIFLGGAAECTMAQWASGYLEQVLGIPKVWGDCFGVALFALMLGMGRTAYSKCGKNISKVLLIGAFGSCACYLLAALSPFPVIGLLACAFTGLCVSMFWPGSLIAASEKYPDGGVLIFALMAAGGDFGASVGPQLIGVITDAIIAVPSAAEVALKFGLTAEQLGMKAGMLIGVVFSVAAIPVYYKIRKMRKKENMEN